MTCIVGIVDKVNHRVVMGADSAESNGMDVSIRKDGKIFRNKDFIIGCTTSYRMIQILRFSFNPPDINGKDIYKYMCTDFINEVRKCFLEYGFLQKREDNSENGGQFLVAYKDRLFKIEDDFQVGESLNSMNSVGCGEPYAIGALHILKNLNISCEEMIEKSLEVSEEYAVGVKRPFIIMRT